MKVQLREFPWKLVFSLSAAALRITAVLVHRTAISFSKFYTCPLQFANFARNRPVILTKVDDTATAGLKNVYGDSKGHLVLTLVVLVWAT